MRFVLDISVDNDAFSPTPDGCDGRAVSRILEDLAGRICGPLHGGDTLYIVDDNGNRVGTAVLKAED